MEVEFQEEIRVFISILKYCVIYSVCRTLPKSKASISRPFLFGVDNEIFGQNQVMIANQKEKVGIC